MKKILSVALVAGLALALAAPVSAGGFHGGGGRGGFHHGGFHGGFHRFGCCFGPGFVGGSSLARHSPTRTMPIPTPIPIAIPTRRTRPIRTPSTPRRRSTSRRRRSLLLPQSNGMSATPAAATTCKAMG
jgi:hypothetical protein